ncbi:hypothetical protein C0J52_15178 [Blattella germanica]|nr:hypothetical protein C0J52_15178 [Blattella germanica]
MHLCSIIEECLWKTVSVPGYHIFRFCIEIVICTTANTIGNDTSARPFPFSSKTVQRWNLEYVH